MNEQPEEKRGPGRPRKGKGARHIDITLSIEVIEALDRLKVNKSQFIDDCLRAHPVIASQLNASPW